MKKTTLVTTNYIFLKMLLVITLFKASEVDAQTEVPYFAIQVSRDITGSGLGGNVCPALSFNYKNSAFTAGPNFQRKQMNFSGIQTNYRYSVAKNFNGKREIFFSGNITFQNSARMCDSYIEIEKSSDTESTYNYNALRLKVIESYVGLGLKLNPTKHFSTFLNVGMGAFNTMNKDYNREMYREKSGVVMRASFCIVYNLK